MNRCSESRTQLRGKGQVGEEDEEEIEKDQFGLTKLKRKGLLLSFVQKRGIGGGGSTFCTTTPVLPWKADETEKGFIGASGEYGGGRQTIIDQPTTSFLSSFPLQPSLLSPIHPGSVRRLGAAVWEYFQYFSSLDNTMQFGGAGVDPSHGLSHQNQRRFLHQHRHHHLESAGDDAGFDHPRPSDFHGPSLADLHPATTDSLRHQVTALIAKHRRAAERTNHHMQPFSPASYGSSMEITRYDEVRTPSSSIEFKARINGEGSYGFKTSSELLKVLNRIWTLEEKHAANTALVKSMKTELNHAHARIKELLRDQKGSRREMDELMKRVSQDKFAWKNREQDMFESTIQSARHELEEERKLRIRSEGMQRRLSREMFEVKVALSVSVKELEKEKRSRYLLEELCDEFASRVKEYGTKLHDMKQKSDVNGIATGSEVNRDSSILHMCELWLDERLQMKGANGGELQGGNETVIVDRLSREIQSFLQTQKLGSGNSTPVYNDHKEMHHMRRNSLESFPLNEGGSAPHFAGNEEDSALSNDLSFETKQMENSNIDTKQKRTVKGRMKGQTSSEDTTYLKMEEASSAANFITSREQQHCQNEIQVIEPALPKDTETPAPVDTKNNSTKSPLRSGKTVGEQMGKSLADDKRSASNKPISELLKSDGGGGCGGGGGGILNRYRSIVGSPDVNLAGTSSKTRRGLRPRLRILRGFT